MNIPLVDLKAQYHSMRDELDVANFVEFLETKGKGQSELAEYGMWDYLTQLSAYEEMLAAGKIKWR